VLPGMQIRFLSGVMLLHVCEEQVVRLKIAGA